MGHFFDIHSFISELRNKPEKKSNTEKYERLVENFDGKEIQDLRFIKEYYSKIKVFPYNIPVELRNDFDWDLLAKLVIGSFSSDYCYEESTENNGLPELRIYIKSGNQAVAKIVSELWSFQILRLYEIYIEEAANLQSLKEEDESERNAIDEERLVRLQRWKNIRSELLIKYGDSELSTLKNSIDKIIES